MTLNEYMIVGRKSPTGANPRPDVYRMRLFAPNPPVAKSRFWYFMGMMYKVKKTQGEIIACNQIFEPRPALVKNFGFFLRYNSRTGTHNMYKEYRDVTRCGAVSQLYQDMAARHRCGFRAIQIIDAKVVPSNKVKRANAKQFINSQIKFPLPHRIVKPSTAQFRRTFRPTRPNTTVV